MRADEDGRVTGFVEKPESDDELFDYYVESCELDSGYDPYAGS